MDKELLPLFFVVVPYARQESGQESSWALLTEVSAVHLGCQQRSIQGVFARRVQALGAQISIAGLIVDVGPSPVVHIERSSRVPIGVDYVADDAQVECAGVSLIMCGNCARSLYRGIDHAVSCLT
ncbi:hypothetical protein AB0B25_08485 [Nocardia sp. NPDC049190]|uniref:hypothetical protein n=1 Tax=Nocardia sp. NPDC049190 TaxID=3155650 RepID=UPI0033E28477